MFSTSRTLNGRVDAPGGGSRVEVQGWLTEDEGTLVSPNLLQLGVDQTGAAFYDETSIAFFGERRLLERPKRRKETLQSRNTMNNNNVTDFYRSK